MPRGSQRSASTCCRVCRRRSASRFIRTAACTSLRDLVLDPLQQMALEIGARASAASSPRPAYRSFVVQLHDHADLGLLDGVPSTVVSGPTVTSRLTGAGVDHQHLERAQAREQAGLQHLPRETSRGGCSGSNTTAIESGSNAHQSVQGLRLAGQLELRCRPRRPGWRPA